MKTLTAFLTLVLAAALPAQISVSPDPLTVGEAATISVTDPTRAGQTITVDIDDGQGHESSVEITLGSDGKGSATWTTPAWSLAKFNTGLLDELCRDIQQKEPWKPHKTS